MILFPDSVFS